MYLHLIILLAYTSLISADVAFTSPRAGDSFAASGGTVDFEVRWQDISLAEDPLGLENADSFTLLLCTGANTQIQCLSEPIFLRRTFSSYEYQASLSASLVASGNWYLQMYTIFNDESTTTSYSSRFELTGMTGPQATFVVTATGPAPAGQTSLTGAAGATTFDTASFDLPYTAQTGIYRFAPMQTQPGSTITATTWTPRYPTSAYTAFQSHAEPPRIVSTITAGWDYSAESAANWASVAPYPTAFYPASERVTSASLSSQRNRRWLD